MKPPRTCLISVMVLLMGLSLACGRATGVPDDAAANAGDAQKAPFDQESESAGTDGTTSGTMVNGAPLGAVNTLPEGTPITIRLLSQVSSAVAHAGDGFAGTLDDPIVMDGQTVVPRGALVAGRVLAAKASGRLHDPGYLRIALVSLTVDGKPLALETSSLFVKGGPHERRPWALAGSTSAFVGEGKEVSFDAERRLTFRLAQALDLTK